MRSADGHRTGASATGSLITAGNLRVAPNLRHLYAYMVENLYIQGIRDFNEACLPILSRDVLAKIRQGDASWEPMVPPQDVFEGGSHSLDESWDSRDSHKGTQWVLLFLLALAEGR